MVGEQASDPLKADEPSGDGNGDGDHGEPEAHR